MDWNLYPNFTPLEFSCSHSGKNEMSPKFMEVLQAIRRDFNRPMVITSGYRDRTHPIEAKKATRGEHTYGCAVDISVSGEIAMELIVIAYAHGIRRIGLNQKGSSRFIHLGMGDQIAGFPKAIWSY